LYVADALSEKFLAGTDQSFAQVYDFVSEGPTHKTAFLADRRPLCFFADRPAERLLLIGY
jgi:hypothetical protein